MRPYYKIKKDLDKIDFSEKVGLSIYEEHVMGDLDLKEFDLGKSLWMRFVRGAVAGAVASGATITYLGGSNIADVRSFLELVAVAIFIGAITGGLQAVDKFLRSE